MKPLGPAVWAGDCTALTLWNAQVLIATYTGDDCQFSSPSCAGGEISSSQDRLDFLPDNRNQLAAVYFLNRSLVKATVMSFLAVSSTPTELPKVAPPDEYVSQAEPDL